MQRSTVDDSFPHNVEFAQTTFGMSEMEVYEAIVSDHCGYWTIIMQGVRRKPLDNIREERGKYVNSK